MSTQSSQLNDSTKRVEKSVVRHNEWCRRAIQERFVHENLPEEMKTGFYKTKDGIHVDFSNNNVWLNNQRITEINLHENIEIVYLNNNYLTELITPKKLTTLSCHNNNLISLEIHDGINWLSCARNNIKSLNVPKSLILLWCDMIDGIEEQNNKNIKMQIYQGNYKFTDQQ